MRYPHLVAAVSLLGLLAAPAWGRTPTPSITVTPSITPTDTFGPSPTATDTQAAPSPTPTGTPPHPYAAFSIDPPVARSGQRVLLDGRGSFQPQVYRWQQIDGDVAIQIDDDSKPVASFLVPPLAAPAQVIIELAVTEDGRTVTSTGMTLFPANTIEVLLAADNGTPGGTSRIYLFLRPWGLGVTSVTHDVRFDAYTAPLVREDGSPDCEAGPAVDLDHAAFSFAPAGCTPGSTCTGVHAEVVARQPMQPETAVYTCRVALNEAPRDPCYSELRCGGGSAISADGVPLTLQCSDGSISASYYYEQPTFSFRAEPAEPKVGDTVELIFTATGEGGLPGYTLSGAEPVLHLAGPTPTPGGGPLGREVRYTTVADCPGTAPLQLQVYYEGRGGCPGSQYFVFKNATSPIFPLVVREAGTSVVRGRVAAYPQTCGGARALTAVVLEPLGWRVITGDDGSFSFGGLAPGEYSVRVEDSCHGQGCYPPQAVTVADAATDQADIVLCPNGVPFCPGDCDANTFVDVAELVRGVQVALGTDDLTACPSIDSNGDDAVVVDDLIRAINAALNGCGA
jgi:hypothetical protein